jgi:stress response protein YsnF
LGTCTSARRRAAAQVRRHRAGPGDRPVEREEVRVGREPITDENADQELSRPELGEAEHEVVLHAEEPVTEKRVVPNERVRLGKETETDERQTRDTACGSRGREAGSTTAGPAPGDGRE